MDWCPDRAGYRPEPGYRQPHPDAVEAEQGEDAGAAGGGGSLRARCPRRSAAPRIKKFARIVKAGHRITGNPQDETRGAGWEFLYVAVDDHSRIAYTALYPDETANSSASFLAEAAAYFHRLGITVRRVLTDNGPCFYAHRFAHACRDLGITHKRTRIYTPRTNGKAERFIQTAIREWAYARRYENSSERSAWLRPWTHQYNWHRPHASLGQAPPISRSGLEVNNLLRHHS